MPLISIAESKIASNPAPDVFLITLPPITALKLSVILISYPAFKTFSSWVVKRYLFSVASMRETLFTSHSALILKFQFWDWITSDSNPKDWSLIVSFTLYKYVGPSNWRSWSVVVNLTLILSSVPIPTYA